MTESAVTEPWVIPASYAQERVWFAAQLVGDSPVYTVMTPVLLPYRLDHDGVLDALRTVVRRQEQLRTSFLIADGELCQAVHGPDLPLPVDFLDLSGLPREEAQRRADAAYEGLAHGVPLDRAPLWRAIHARFGEAEQVVMFAASHAVVDGLSVGLLRAELGEACAAAAEGRPPVLPELAVQYADYAVWQRDTLAAGELDRLAAFWRDALAGIPTVHGIATDLPRPAERSFAGSTVRSALPDGAPDAVPALARRAGATPFVVLFAAWVALLRRWSDADDVVVGVPVAGRERPELQPVIGMFVNVLAVRVRLAGDPTFDELLAECRNALFDAFDHAEMPFQVLVEQLADRADPAVPPLYQIGFNVIDVGFGWRPGSAEDDLLLEVSGDEILVEHNTALFTEQTARTVLEDYRAVVAAVAADPGTRLSALPVSSRAAAPAPAAAAVAEPVAPTDHVAPRTAAEELVASVWAEVLEVDRVGATDDFFELGGHSLRALRVIARLNAAAGIELPIQDFFADSTVAGVAARIEDILAAELDEMTDDEAARLVERSGG